MIRLGKIKRDKMDKESYYRQFIDLAETREKKSSELNRNTILFAAIFKKS